jgi:hypothetical protein
MRVFSDFAEILPGLSPAQMVTAVILAAFALSAFAIYAVCQIARERGK